MDKSNRMRIIAIVGVSMMVFIGACKSSSSVSSSATDSSNSVSSQQETKTVNTDLDSQPTNKSSNGIVNPLGVSTQSGGQKKSIPIKKSSSGGN